MTPMERGRGVPGTGYRPAGLPNRFEGEEVPVPLARLLCGHTINDGAGMIKLELPHIVEGGAPTLVSVEVNWKMVLAKAVARLYLIADLNAVPLLARITLLPDIVPPHLALEVRLEMNTHVRAVVQCGDGTALQVKHWVWVMPPFGADPTRSGYHFSDRSSDPAATSRRGNAW